MTPSPTDPRSAAIVRNACFMSAGIALLASAPYVALTVPSFFHGDDWVYLYHYARTPVWRLDAFFALESHFFWRPLFKIAIPAQYLLFGMRPEGYHIVSIALHVASTGAMGAFIGLWTRRAGLAAMAALFFTTTWVVGDSVTWMSSQSTLLESLLRWSALGCWVVWLRRPERAWTRYLAAGLFLGQLLVKESALNMLPAFVILSCAEWFPRDASAREILDRRKLLRIVRSFWPLLLVAAGFCLLFFGFVRDTSLGERGGYAFAPFAQALRQIGMATTHLLLAPLGGADDVTGAPASALYMFFMVRLPVLGLVGGAAAFLCRTPFARGAFLLTLILLLPTVLLTAFHQGRYYYGPSQAFALLLAAGACQLSDVARRRIPSKRIAVVAVAGVVVAVYCGAGWSKLWTMTGVDAARSDPDEQLYKFLQAHANDIPPRSLLIVNERRGRTDWGLREAVKLGTGQDSCEAVFRDQRIPPAQYRRIVDDTDRAFHVRKRDESADLGLVAVNKAQLFPPR